MPCVSILSTLMIPDSETESFFLGMSGLPIVGKIENYTRKMINFTNEQNFFWIRNHINYCFVIPNNFVAVGNPDITKINK